MYAFVNDSFIPAEKATLPVSDLALNRGYGVFDYMKTVEGQPVFMKEHLDRLFRSAGEMRLQLPFTREELRTILGELIGRNSLQTSGIRIVVTGGSSPDGYSITTPNLVITQQALTLPSDMAFQKGLRLLSYSHQRQLPHIKTIDYLMPVWLQSRLGQLEADDLLYHREGLVTECPRANVFAVMEDGRIITPAENILRGITRQKILDLGKDFYTLEEGPLTIKDLLSAKEVFITSTTKEILPVAALDGQPLGKGRSVATHIKSLVLNAQQTQTVG